MTELRDSTDESDLREDRDHPGSGLCRSSILTYLGAGFAGLLGSLVSVMLTIGYLFYKWTRLEASCECISQTC